MRCARFLLSQCRGVRNAGAREGQGSLEHVWQCVNSSVIMQGFQKSALTGVIRVWGKHRGDNDSLMSPPRDSH